jgi:hypothetical protein
MDTCKCRVDMKNGFAAGICCRDMQHGNTAGLCSMERKHGPQYAQHATWTHSMDMKHRNSERTWSIKSGMEKQQEHAHSLFRPLLFPLPSGLGYGTGFPVWGSKGRKSANLDFFLSRSALSLFFRAPALFFASHSRA